MIKATIVEKRINDTLLSKVVFAITYIKNLCPTRALEELINLTKMQNKDFPNLYHLYILSSTVYIFPHIKK